MLTHLLEGGSYQLFFGLLLGHTPRGLFRILTLLCVFQGGQQTLETLRDPEKPWILFSPGKIPWKTLKLQHSPEKLCSEADVPRVNF